MATVKIENKRNVIDVSRVTVTEGQTLKVETSPDGEELVAELCPVGETWTVTMHIEVQITD